MDEKISLKEELKRTKEAYKELANEYKQMKSNEAINVAKKRELSLKIKEIKEKIRLQII